MISFSIGKSSLTGNGNPYGSDGKAVLIVEGQSVFDAEQQLDPLMDVQQSDAGSAGLLLGLLQLFQQPFFKKEPLLRTSTTRMSSGPRAAE